MSKCVWEGVKDLVDRCMPHVVRDQLVEELRAQQDMAGEWSVSEVKSCTSNLLKFYHDRKESVKRIPGAKTEYPLAERFAMLVFSIHVSSSIIETYFSKTLYII